MRRLRSLWFPVSHHTFPHYSGYYDDESRAFVADVYRRDIEAFNHAFEGGTRLEPRRPDLASDAGPGA